MQRLSEALEGHLVVVNLGCIGDMDYPVPAWVRRCTTLVEVDAVGASKTGGAYFRKIGIQRPIAGTKGKRVFRQNTFAGGSSLLEPDTELIHAYGMERYYRELKSCEWECDTLPSVLAERGIDAIDFLKTDLEGADYEVLQSCAEMLYQTLWVQAELRFQPFYKGERPFHEAVDFLSALGFELFDLLHVERWKYRTPHRLFQSEGRAVWTDCLFTLQPDLIKRRFAPADLAMSKCAIVACMLGKLNYAEYLTTRYETLIPADWRHELRAMVRPGLLGYRQWGSRLRAVVRPLSLTARHLLGRSSHVAVRD